MKPYHFVDDDGGNGMSLDLAIAVHKQKATYALSSLPPPYPGIAPLQSSSILPSYSNSIYLRAIMPCKTELSAPGVPAKDRKWRRVLCELDGTVFRVYECSRGWWDDTIGVGDASTHGSTTYNPSGLGKMDVFEEETHSASSQLIPHTSSPHSGISVPAPSPLSLIKTYSLQQCKSNVARYYPKRKNVIRVRMDGEQFLLQAMNSLEVIQWIEGLQAATNIALDLDQRLMP